MRDWEIAEIKRAIWSCKNKKKSHYENTGCKISNAIRNEETKLKALSRRLPRRVINEPIYTYGDVSYTALCPCCRQDLGFEAQHTYKFCFNCGQALDWSEDNA